MLSLYRELRTNQVSIARQQCKSRSESEVGEEELGHRFDENIAANKLCVAADAEKREPSGERATN